MDELEKAVNAGVAACDGDLIATVRALIILNRLAQAEIEELKASTSKGYRRKAS